MVKNDFDSRLVDLLRKDGSVRELGWNQSVGWVRWKLSIILVQWFYDGR